MIQKIAHSIFFSLLVLGSAFAQSNQVEWGEMEAKSGYLIEMMPLNGKDFYSLRWKGGNAFGGYYISRHDDLKTTVTDKVIKSVNNSIANFETSAIIEDHPVIFLSDKKENHNLLYAQQYGYDLKPRGEAKLLVDFSLDKGQSYSGYNIIQSKDKKFFAVLWIIQGKKKDKNTYGYAVFNEKFEVIHEWEYELPFEAQYSEVSEHLLTNSGDYFLAVKEFEKSEEKKVFRNFLQYKAMHIYQVAEDGLEDYSMQMRGNRVEAISIDSDDDQNFIITGVYGHNQVEGVKGLFYLKLDYKNEKVIEESFEEFKKDFIIEDWSEKELERAERREEKGKGAPTLYDYKMRDVFIMPDGSIIGSLEQNYVMVRSFSDTRGMTTTTYTYYYNDIIAFKIGSNDGGFEWLQKIKKMQVSTNDGGPYSSYASYIDGNSMKFIFNDSRANYDENGNYVEGLSFLTRFTNKDNVVSFTEVNLSDGSLERKSLFSKKEMGTLAIPKMFEVDYINKHVLLYTTFRSKERYGLLKFEE